MKDARIIDQATGNRLNYTCENARFKTDVTRGHPHGQNEAAGSAYDDALLWSNGWSLWLEHIVEKQTGVQLFWLMWYDPAGKPTIPMSGVFARADFEEMIGRLARKL